MRGRYGIYTDAAVLAHCLRNPTDIQACYNIAPMRRVPIVRLNSGSERELSWVRWGRSSDLHARESTQERRCHVRRNGDDRMHVALALAWVTKKTLHRCRALVSMVSNDVVNIHAPETQWPAPIHNLRADSVRYGPASDKTVAGANSTRKAPS